MRNLSRLLLRLSLMQYAHVYSLGHRSYDRVATVITWIFRYTYVDWYARTMRLQTNEWKQVIWFRSVLIHTHMYTYRYTWKRGFKMLKMCYLTSISWPSSKHKVSIPKSKFQISTIYSSPSKCIAPPSKCMVPPSKCMAPPSKCMAPPSKCMGPRSKHSKFMELHECINAFYGIIATEAWMNNLLMIWNINKFNLAPSILSFSI